MEAKKFGVIKAIQIIIPAIIGLVLSLTPPPDGLTTAAMIFIGIFICAICWLIFNVISDYVVVILAMALFVVLKVSDMTTVFSPFASSSVWVVIGAFAIAAMVGKSGLLKRIALNILRIFPENYRGQVLALFASGVVIAPLIPSMTAKGAILAPFANSAAKALGYVKGSKAATGMFLAAWVTCGLLGMAFVSGAVPVFTILGFLPEPQRAEWGWVQWFLASAIWFALVAVLCFVVIMVLYNPKKDKDHAEVQIEKGFAKKQLAEIGSITRDEKFSAAFLALALLGWIFGSLIGLDAGIWAIIIMCLMLAFGLMTAKDFGTRISWSSIFFIGGVFSLAGLISSLKINVWLAGILEPFLAPLAANPFAFVALICIVTYVLRYLVISQTAVLAIFFASLGGICLATGINAWVLLFTCYVSTLVWHFPFTNVTYAVTLGSTNGEMTEHKQTLPMNYAYMVVNLIGCLASVPLWMAMGMI